VRINEAIAETVDAIGNDPDYEIAQRLLAEAEQALASGTTAEAAALLNRAIAEVDKACPL